MEYFMSDGELNCIEIRKDENKSTKVKEAGEWVLEFWK